LQLSVDGQKGIHMSWSKVFGVLANFVSTGASATAATAATSTEGQIAAAIAGILSLILGVVTAVRTK